MDIKDLIKDYGIHVTIKDNPKGHNPPKIVDDNGYSALLWSSWGIKLKMVDGKGYLLYIPEDLVKE